MQVEVSQPIYLDSYYDNITEVSTWNKDVSAALTSIAKRIEASSDAVVSVEIEKDENLGEFAKASGYIGFATEASKKTDYYFVDFRIVHASSNSSDIKADSSVATKALLDELGNYLTNSGEYSLSSCKLEDGEYWENFQLRAYFVKVSGQ